MYRGQDYTTTAPPLSAALMTMSLYFQSRVKASFLAGDSLLYWALV